MAWRAGTRRCSRARRVAVEGTRAVLLKQGAAPSLAACVIELDAQRGTSSWRGAAWGHLTCTYP